MFEHTVVIFRGFPALLAPMQRAESSVRPSVIIREVGGNTVGVDSPDIAPILSRGLLPACDAEASYRVV